MIVSVIGSKGGAGKTTISHLLALGAALNDTEAAVLQTDDRPLFYSHEVKGADRGYAVIDCKKQERFDQIIASTSQHPDALFIIDGGADRRSDDVDFAGVSDLVVIPFRRGYEDFIVALRDYRDVKDYAPVLMMPSQFRVTDQPKWLDDVAELGLNVSKRFPLQSACDSIVEEKNKRAKDIPSAVRGTATQLFFEVKRWHKQLTGE